MNVLVPWFETAWAERLGWTLVHSVWQAAIIAALFAVVAWALRRAAANARYVVGCAALVAMVAWPLATFVRLSDSPAAALLPRPLEAVDTLQDPVLVAADAEAVQAFPPAAIGSAPQPVFKIRSHEQLSAWAEVIRWVSRPDSGIAPMLPWFSMVWMLGVAVLAMRPMWGLVVVQRLRSTGLTPLSTELRQMAGRVMVRLDVRAAVQFAESALVEVPTVVGYLRPMVLLPASAVIGLTSVQLEMVLAHELAHIRRHDYLVNLLQTVIEALLFFHPAMWWVSARVRAERENCCDDVAMGVADNRGQYTRALYLLESLRRPAQPALAAAGGSLVARVRRLLLPPEKVAADRRGEWLAGVFVLCLIAVLIFVGRTVAEPTNGKLAIPTGQDAQQRTEVREFLASLPDLPAPAYASPKSKHTEITYYDVNDPKTQLRIAVSLQEERSRRGWKPVLLLFKEQENLIDEGEGATRRGPEKLLRDLLVDDHFVAVTPSSSLATSEASRAAITLTGRIVFDGPPPGPRMLSMPAKPYLPPGESAAEIQVPDKALVVDKDGGIANVVVWARSKDFPVPPFSGKLSPSTLRAVDNRFEPHVLAFWNAASLVWVNDMTDAVNFDWSNAVRSSLNMLVPAGERREFTDLKPEPVPAKLRSNLQPWMSAYILPLAHTCFAVTGDDGRFEIENLPLGEWEFGIWHERTGWLKTDRFESGHFRWTIRKGENALGDLRVAPATILENQSSTTPPAAVVREADIDRLDEQGFSQLHRAASGGHTQRVRDLLAAGANVNVEQKRYRGTPLQYAAHQGHGDTVQALIDGGANVNARDTNDRTSLVWAAMGGHADVAKRLLDAGADVNAKNSGGWTPLHFAVDRGHDALAVLLIDRGAHVRARNSQGKMAGDLKLELAARITGLVVSSSPPSDERPLKPPGVAATEARGETTDVAVDEPRREPTEVVATILSRDITAAEIEPPPSWYAERQKRIESGKVRESDTAETYRARQLSGLIAGPLFDEYRKQEKLEPTEEQIEEFLKHYQLAKVRSQQERARELAKLREEAVELEARLEAGDLSAQEAARASKRLETVQSQVAILDKASKRHGILEDSEKQDRFFAEWQVRRWNLQASLYRRYGGRAVWQQAGNEALDAMRDYLREQEREGKFTIHDPLLREKFWKIYAPEKLLFEISDPERVFEHPWSAFNPTGDTKTPKSPAARVEARSP